MISAIQICSNLLKFLKYSIKFTDMGNMNELTVNEIAEKLGVPFETVKVRIRSAGINPVRKVGRTNIYDPSVVEAIRNVPGKGRPKKAAAPEPAKPAKKARK
jgi:hypothetical protein